uniref:transmembrane and ubiquitin-like domain-containing protein 1 n=1 Tax=Myxine glutinosa TaxID=7769 RepID=UPI00358F8E46
MEESLFEGFGNEVVYVGAFVLVLLSLGLAWLSTHVRGPDGPRGSGFRRPGGEGEGEGDGVSTSPPSQNDDDDAAPPPPPPMPDHPPSGGPEEDQGEHDVEVEEKETERELRSGADGGDPGEVVDPSGSPRLRHRQVAAEQIRIRLKFLNDTERVIDVNLGDTIGHIKRTHFPGQEAQVRFIYGGQILQDEGRTLMSYGVLADCVVHCHIARTTAGTAPRPRFEGGLYNELYVRADTLLNVGNLMIPLSLFMLSIMWYFRIAYKQLFTAPATISLIGMTLLFGCFIFNTYRR